MLTALPEEVCSDDGDRGHDGRSSSAEDSLCARRVTGIISLMCTMILWSVDSCPPLHFSHGGTEAEKGEVTCPCPWVGGDRSWTWTLRGAWLQAETAVSRPERLAFLILHAEHNLSAERAEKFAGGLLPVLALHVLRLGAPLRPWQTEMVGPLVGARTEERVGWICLMDLGDPPAMEGSGSLMFTLTSGMRSACEGTSSQPVCAFEGRRLHPVVSPLERRFLPM